MKKEFKIKYSAASPEVTVAIDEKGISCREDFYEWNDIDGIIRFRNKVKMLGMATNESFAISLRNKKTPSKWMDLSTTIAFGSGKSEAEDTFHQLMDILKTKVEDPLLDQLEYKLKSGEEISFLRFKVAADGIHFRYKKSLFSAAQNIILSWDETTMFESTVEGHYRVSHYVDKKLGFLVPVRTWNIDILKRYIGEKRFK